MLLTKVVAVTTSCIIYRLSYHLIFHVNRCQFHLETRFVEHALFFKIGIYVKFILSYYTYLILLPGVGVYRLISWIKVYTYILNLFYFSSSKYRTENGSLTEERDRIIHRRIHI